MKKKNQEGYITCKVCEKAFKIINKKFEYPLSNYINEDLEDYCDDLPFEEYELIRQEPFHLHLNEHQHCPGSRCELCHNEEGCKLKLFETRHQRNYHMKQVHSTKDQMKGRTGFNTLIREEVLRQTQQHINKMMEIQKDYDLVYPTIEVKITGYQGKSKDIIQKETLEEKTKKKEENLIKLKKQRQKKEHEKILANLQLQIEAQIAEVGHLNTD